MRELAYLIAAGIFVGTAVESAAHALSLWIFTVTGFVFLQVLFVQGMAMGTLTWSMMDASPMTQFALSALAGGALEFANIFWFTLWEFPGDTFLFLKGKWAVALAMTILWGFFCPFVLAVGKAFAARLSPPDAGNA